MKYANSREVILKGKIALCVYIFLALIFLYIGLSLSTSNDYSAILSTLGFVTLFSWRAYLAYNRIKIGKLFDPYMELIFSSDSKNIHCLAENLHISEKTLRKNLMDMREAGLLKNLTISDKGIIKVQLHTVHPLVTNSSNEKRKEIISLSCPTCGAPITVINGSSSAC
ncbi:MAG: hypothetical protein GXZ11_05990 [Tissierellia bacterium]|nr:hypothetical protein [Tissierellia bacterium]